MARRPELPRATMEAANLAENKKTPASIDWNGGYFENGRSAGARTLDPLIKSQSTYIWNTVLNTILTIF